MKVEIKNDTVKIRYINKFETETLGNQFSSLVLPETSKTWEQDILNQGDISPLLIGEVVDISEKKLKNGKMFKPADFKIGDKVIFMVLQQLIYKEDEEVYYIVGYGNILAVVE